MKTATDKGAETSLDKRLLKVLLVEDEATDKISVERILRTCSSPVEFVVESVVTLSEAIGNLAEKKYDVVLLDLELPDSSGIETLRQTVKVAPDIPVVVLTELEDEQTGFSALEDGATDYLVKDLPLDVVLVRTIVYALHRKKIQMQSLKLTHDINERMKEINCLYGISKLVEAPGISSEEIFEKTVCLIPAGWQYPDIACARIIFEGKEYKTDNFKPSKWTQSADITLQGQKVGTVEVGYMEERPQSDEGPFLEEKRDLIDAIGERLGKMAERFKAEETQKRLVALIEATPDFVGFADAKDKHIIYVNKAGRKMCGIGNDEDVTKLNISDVHPEWTNKMYAEEILPAAVRDGVWTGECAFLNIRDRHEIPVSMVLSSHKTSNGEVEVFSTISRDITERKNMEEALHRNEARYRSSVELTGQLIWTTDSNGEVVEDIPLWRKFTGLSYEETKGSGWTKALHPEDAEHTGQVWDKAVKDKSAYEVEYRLRRFDGVYRDFLTRGIPVLKEDGSIREWVGVNIDITERKQAEEVLKEAKAFTESTLNSIADIFYSFDLSGKFLSWNKTFNRISGYSDQELSSKKPIDFFLGEDIQRIAEDVERIYKEGTSKTEANFVLKDGRQIPCEFTGSILKDGKGNIIGFSGTGRDITEHKKAEKALRESEERYKNLFKANVDGILISDATTKKFRYANPAICRMLGYSEEELTQMGVADIHPKESLEQVFAEFEAQASGAKITAKDLQCVRKDGQVISVSINASTVMIGQNEYLMGIFRDVTERKNKEKQMLDANRRLEKVSEELSAAKRDLEQKNEALQKVCSELEQRVKEQTAELAAANRSLGDKGYYK
jgi:PAS domain S-box-containing protein